MSKKLTVRQAKALARLLRHPKDESALAIDPTLASQLDSKGLVVVLGVYERKEWNRVKARLTKVILSPDGRAEAERVIAEGLDLAPTPRRRK